MEELIREATKEDIEKIIVYVIDSRKQIFPFMLDSRKIPDDLQSFEENYIKASNSIFFIAIAEEKIIGTIGLLPYDNRIKAVQFTQRTGEIVRLFVSTKYRRMGLGIRLANMIFRYAKLLNYQLLYLHTHPFLDGAVDFWEKNNFKTMCTTYELEMLTIHMTKKVE